jgi:hypothetical protein
MSMKNSIDTIGNQTRDFPALSAMPQPTAPPAACPHKKYILEVNSKKQLNMRFTSFIFVLKMGGYFQAFIEKKYLIFLENFPSLEVFIIRPVRTYSAFCVARRSLSVHRSLPLHHKQSKRGQGVPS